MTRRLTAVLLTAVSVAGGCSGSEGPGSTADPNSSVAPAAGTEPGSVPDDAPTPTDGTIDASSPTVLANGLRVLVTPIADATSVAIVLTFDVGSHHDPPGRSGLAHFAEHLLVTGATSAEPARTVDDLVAAYPLGWNAQTGSDYTVIAGVVTSDRLEAELTLIAARLAGVTATVEDVERERPRILGEVENMFGGIADLAVVNAAKEQLLPTPNGGRRGGDPATLAAITPEEIAEWLGYYNPATATLSIAGPVDPAAITTTVTSLFEPLAAGPQPPPPTDTAPGSPGMATVDVAGADQRLVAVAYAAPAAASDDHLPFLVAAYRLFSAGPASELMVSYAPIDDPSVLVVAAAMSATEAPTEAAARVAGEIERIVAEPLGVDEAGIALAAFGPLLGLAPNPANPYGTAFATARTSPREPSTSAALDAATYGAVIARTFIDVELTGASTRSSS